MQPAEDMTEISKIDAHPIFSFADGEMGPVANSFIRAMEKVTGQPKIKKIYLVFSTYTPEDDIVFYLWIRF